MNQHLAGRRAQIGLHDGTRHVGRDVVVAADSTAWVEAPGLLRRTVPTASVGWIETTGFARPLLARRAFWVGVLGTVGLVQARALLAGADGGGEGIAPLDIGLAAAGAAAGGVATARLWRRPDADGMAGRFVLTPRR